MLPLFLPVIFLLKLIRVLSTQKLLNGHLLLVILITFCLIIKSRRDRRVRVPLTILLVNHGPRPIRVNLLTVTNLQKRVVIVIQKNAVPTLKNVTEAVPMLTLFRLIFINTVRVTTLSVIRHRATSIVHFRLKCQILLISKE